MQKREDEQQQIADFIGSGNLPQSLSDEIVDDLRKPEIMEVDISDLVSTKETVVPPDIIKFANKQNFFGRVAGRFKRFFSR